MILVVYRILYGTDFLERSMRSVYDGADKIFVGYSSEPWSRPVNFPNIRDIEQSPVDVIHKHFDLSEGKIMVMNQQQTTPKGEFNYLYSWAVDLLGKPDLVVFMEPDMVWAPGVFKSFVEEAQNKSYLFAPQLELWKTQEYRIRRKNNVTRLGPSAYKEVWGIPEFNFGAYNSDITQEISAFGCYNFGFCLNEKTMLYKHKASIDFSEKINDSIPVESWYKEKWLNWTLETINLEPASKHIDNIPKAEPYDMPEDMRKFMDENPVKNT